MKNPIRESFEKNFPHLADRNWNGISGLHAWLSTFDDKIVVARELIKEMLEYVKNAEHWSEPLESQLDALLGDEK